MSFQPQQQGAQVCYRHPDKRAGVACQRCDRPICPSCMIPASVGFHCPECVSAAAAPQRQFSKLQARMNTPYVVYTLIGINVFIFLMSRADETILSGPYSSFTGRFLLIAGSDFYPGEGVAGGQWWRVVTSGFLHSGIMHIAFNMWALYVIGTILEKVLGSTKFALIYFVSLFGGSMGALALSGPLEGTVGASGAIFGLMGAFVLLQLSRGQNPMDGGVGPVILINLVITFAIPGISVGGHLGGLLTGALCGVVLFGHNPVEAHKRNASAQGPLWIVAGLGVFLLVASFVIANAVVDNGQLISF